MGTDGHGLVFRCSSFIFRGRGEAVSREGAKGAKGEGRLSL